MTPRRYVAQQARDLLEAFQTSQAVSSPFSSPRTKVLSHLVRSCGESPKGGDSQARCLLERLIVAPFSSRTAVPRGGLLWVSRSRYAAGLDTLRYSTTVAAARPTRFDSWRDDWIAFGFGAFVLNHRASQGKESMYRENDRCSTHTLTLGLYCFVVLRSPFLYFPLSFP